MTIQYAILGLLSWRKFSGYDLKKVFADSDLFYWSGNNNQIYKTLIQLHREGLVSSEVQAQESLPAKKIYTITTKGDEALKRWLLSTPELPELHHTFLIQLAWSGELDDDELDGLLARYEDEIRIQWQMQQEKARRGAQIPQRTAREAFLWTKALAHIAGFYENELAWTQELRQELAGRKYE